MFFSDHDIAWQQESPAIWDCDEGMSEFSNNQMEFWERDACASLLCTMEPLGQGCKLEVSFVNVNVNGFKSFLPLELEP